MKSRKHDIILKNSPRCAILILDVYVYAQGGRFFDLQLQQALETVDR